MEKTMKIVDFTYCKSCKFYDTKEWEDPCNKCLCCSVNENSEKPLYYEEKK